MFAPWRTIVSSMKRSQHCGSSTQRWSPFRVLSAIRHHSGRPSSMATQASSRKTPMNGCTGCKPCSEIPACEHALVKPPCAMFMLSMDGMSGRNNVQLSLPKQPFLLHKLSHLEPTRHLATQSIRKPIPYFPLLPGDSTGLRSRYLAFTPPPQPVAAIGIRQPPPNDRLLIFSTGGAWRRLNSARRSNP